VQEWESLKRFLSESWLGDEVTFIEANRMYPWNEDLCRNLAEVFERRPAEDWERLLVAEGVPCCSVAMDNDEGFYLHPQAIHLGMIDENTHPDYSNLRQVGVQVLFSETPSADRQPAAGLGQHTVEILQELGFSELEISDMRGARVIGVP
jgi:crotonobetainyl-CoA:carnitine CoA-transferase CaiB-like acyl-CoA transferase